MEAGEKQDMKRFVTFEGIDGSGKSTISKLVYERLQSEGIKVVLTVEPTDTEVGRFVQQCIQTNGDPYVTAFAFIADRIQHCHQIREWLSQGYVVLCDRYADSTYAYQGAQLEEEVRSPIRWLQELSHDRILVPDRTFVFVVDPKTALARIQHRKALIPFERIAFLEKVQKNYLRLAREKRYCTVDATKTKEELTELCYQDILA